MSNQSDHVAALALLADAKAAVVAELKTRRLNSDQSVYRISNQEVQYMARFYREVDLAEQLVAATAHLDQLAHASLAERGAHVEYWTPRASTSPLADRRTRLSQ